MAMFVMALTLSSQNGRGFTTLIVSPNGRISELALKNADLAAYFPSSGHSSHNGWPVATFDWTNKSRSVAADNMSWEAAATNMLIQ